jgi:hypothetical protein
MTNAARSFTLATREEVQEQNAEYPTIDYAFIDPDEPLPKGKTEKDREPRVCVAHYPGRGIMFNMAAAIGQTDAELQNPAGAVYEFLHAAFNRDDYIFLKKQITADRLTIRGEVMPMIQDMMGEWSGFPTKQ